MLARVRDTVKHMAPPKPVAKQLLAVFAIFGVFAGSAAAASQDELKSQIQTMGDFVILIILGVAVPNGAYGFLEWMTAGSSVEQDERGRKRVKYTFLGLAGAAVIKLGVKVFISMMDIGN